MTNFDLGYSGTNCLSVSPAVPDMSSNETNFPCLHTPKIVNIEPTKYKRTKSRLFWYLKKQTNKQTTNSWPAPDPYPVSLDGGKSLYTLYMTELNFMGFFSLEDMCLNSQESRLSSLEIRLKCDT